MARVKKIFEEPPGDWETTFCALSIILVAFFVMLCSYATLEKGKIIEVQRSFKGALMIFEGGVLFDKGDGIVVPSPDQSGMMEQRVAAPIYYFLKGRGLEEEISLKSTGEYVMLSILDSMLFDEGSAELKDSSKTVIAGIARIVGDMSVSVRVEGHTDDRPSSSDVYKNNWELSAMRAVNTMNFIRSAGGISAEKISAVGFAQYRPFLPNRTDEERRRNRRVDIIIPLIDTVMQSRNSILRDAPPSFKVWDLKVVR